MNVNAYWMEEGAIVELGMVTEDDIGALMVRAQNAPAEASGFGLYRTKDEFVEFCYVGNGGFMLHSDALFRQPGWWGWLTSKAHLNRVFPDIGKTNTCVRDYFRLSREAFEQKYR